MSYNHISLLGTIFKAMPIKQLDKIGTVLSFTLDVDDSYTTKENTTVQRSFKIDAELWGQLATKYINDIIAGHLVLIEGSIKLTSWDEPSGTKRYKHVITVKQVVNLSKPSSDEQAALKQRENILYQDNPF